MLRLLSPRGSKSRTSCETPTITIIGIGDAGCNTVARMQKRDILHRVRYVCVDTDVKSLGKVEDADIVCIGRNTTRGFGTKGAVSVAERALNESRPELEDAIGNGEVAFIVAGLGGGIGTTVSPVVADIVQRNYRSTYAIVTTPLASEGTKRCDIAKGGLSTLRDIVDSLYVIENDRIRDFFADGLTLIDALKRGDDSLAACLTHLIRLVREAGENFGFSKENILELPYSRQAMAVSI